MLIQTHLGSLAVFVLILGPTVAWSQPSPVRGMLHVTGEATVKVVPDTVRVTFTIGTSRPTVQAARESSDINIKRVKEAIAALKLKGVEVQVVGVNMTQVTERNPDGTTKVAAYQTRCSFIILVKEGDLDQLRATATRVVDTSVQAGGVGLNSMDEALPPGVAPAPAPQPAGGFKGFKGKAVPAAAQSAGPTVEWLKADTAAVRRQAIAEATKDALANAKALANGVTVRVIETTLIEGSTIRDRDDAGPFRTTKGASTVTQSSNPESLSITVRVRMIASP